MRETEITVQIFNNMDEIKEKLMANNFKLTGDYLMQDWYFSKHSKQTLKEMDYKEIINSSFIVRYVKEENDKKIVFKDKVLDENGNVISEEKIKCKIDDVNSAIKIFERAGLNLWCNLTQHMLEYKNNKMKFAIQIIDGLGSFIEYEEDDLMAGLTEQQKIDLMVKNLKELGFNLGNDYSVKKVYLKFKQAN